MGIADKGGDRWGCQRLCQRCWKVRVKATEKRDTMPRSGKEEDVE